MVIHDSAYLLREVPASYAARFVVDASVALKWIWDEEKSDEARSYARRAVKKQAELFAPALLWYELANALRYGKPRDDADDPHPWDVLQTVPMHTIDFLPEAFPLITRLAAEQNITVYDGTYVFLAQSLSLPLVTADQKLADACSNVPHVWLLDA